VAFPLPAVRRRPLVAALWLIVALAAATQLVRLGVFMIDPHRPSASVLPGNAFFRQHSCLTSFTEAAQFAEGGQVNVYDPLLYSEPGCTDVLTCSERSMGPLKVDIFQYPPTFLLLPALARAAIADFWTIRIVWFVAQVALLGAATILLARWIGGRPGLAAAALSVVLWASPSTLVGIQIGNFQATAFALGILGMIALATGRSAAGGAAIGFAAASKLYPAVLAVYLLGRRRWRSAGWIAAGGVLSTLAALALVGPRPFIDFLQYQLPRLNSGDAFFWVDLPPAVLANYGIYGLLGRLRTLGILEFTRETGALVSAWYGVGLFAAALLAGWSMSRAGRSTDDERDRLREAQVWLALLNLGSFRSPFVPDAYALMGTMWLLTLVAAERSPITRSRVLVFALAAAMFALVLDGIFATPPRWLVLLTLVNQIASLGLNGWVLSRAIAPAPAVAGARRPVAIDGCANP
jgi:alpha-1,2-mannosyltransferase